MNQVVIKSLSGEVVIGGGNGPLPLICGPCVIESREHIMFMAEKLSSASDAAKVKLIFKSSYDKANRTSLSGYRGMGIDEGLKILAEVRKEFGVPVITDVHTEEEALLVGEIVDVVQIPAFLCRQTSLLSAAGKTGKVVMIKKGQFLHPSDMAYAAEKVRNGGSSRVILCERGNCFGYRDLVVDFRSFSYLKESGCPVVFDATHSVQSMGGAGGASSGNRSFVPSLARAAVSYGVDGVFIEAHNSPDQAPSDGPNMIALESIPALFRDLRILYEINLETRA